MAQQMRSLALQTRVSRFDPQDPQWKEELPCRVRAHTHVHPTHISTSQNLKGLKKGAAWLKGSSSSPGLRTEISSHPYYLNVSPKQFLSPGKNGKWDLVRIQRGHCQRSCAKSC